MSTATLIVILIAVIAIAVALWAFLRMKKTDRLHSKFGPEYDRLMQLEGNRSRAESELAEREKRVKKFCIRELTSQERDRFADAWLKDQTKFVDDPGAAVMSADKLVIEVMSARGYPMSDFETQAADVSVDHAGVVDNYREGHDIAERCRRGQTNTEDLRRAMICYRTLFEDLLGGRVAATDQPEEVRR